MCPLWLTIGKAALSETRVLWYADDANAAQEERRSYLRRANRGGVVDSGVVAGSGELPGSSSVGDGHAWLPCAPGRAIHDDRVVLSDRGLLAQRARRRCVAYVETLVQQARTPTMSSTHGHAFLELCNVPDSELAAVVVEHSVVIRVTSFKDFQLTSMRPMLHRLLMICKACDVVANIWVSIPCTAGTPFRRIDEKLGAETGDFVMSYKLVVAAVALSRHTVGIGDTMVLCSAGMYALSNVLQEKLLERVCTVKEALGILGAFGTLIFVTQACSLEWRRFVDITWTSAMVLHVLGSQMCPFGTYVLTSLFFSVGDAENLSVLTSDTCGVAWFDVQSIVELILMMKLPAEQTRRLSWRLGLASALMVPHGYSGEIQDNLLVRWFWWALAMVSFCFVAVRHELASDLFTPGGRLTQYGLTDHNAVKHRWYYLPTMQMDGVLPFKRSDSDTVLTGCMAFHVALADPTVRPDSPESEHRGRLPCLSALP